MQPPLQQVIYGTRDAAASKGGVVDRVMLDLEDRDEGDIWLVSFDDNFSGEAAVLVGSASGLAP